MSEVLRIAKVRDDGEAMRAAGIIEPTKFLQGLAPMMMTAHPSSVEQKRDLHIGGVGSPPLSVLAAIQPVELDSDTLIDRARSLAQNADNFVRDNPWPALGLVAVLGLAAGFLLGRRP